MSSSRLTPLDASFLAVETPTAHMHVGWVALFTPRPAGVTFEALRDHIAGRLRRAPRYRQRLVGVPLGLGEPVWVDDEDFDVDRHVLHAAGANIDEIADGVLSVALARDRPLWELWIADALADGSIGVVAKVHHCMVDGVAAVELAMLLVDPAREPPPSGDDTWRPAPAPGGLSLLATGVRDLARRQLELAALPARLLRSPRRVPGALDRGGQVLGALGDALRPAPRSGLNAPMGPDRLLARTRRPLADLRAIGSRHGATINDVVLAATAGAVRRFLQERGELPVRLKTMVPVNVRADGEDGPGNRISCMFVDLPCDEPDPLRRLTEVTHTTSGRKRAHQPEAADTILQALAYIPSPLRRLASRLATGPRTFNLVVSNVPGPAEPLYLCGCELSEAYPVVPLADRHGLSIGFTTVRDQGCFGIYADRESLADAALLAEDIDGAIDELLRYPAGAPSRRPRRPTPPRRPVHA